MEEIKVLALDLDGTLTNSQKEVTPRTRAALDAAIAKGVTIVLASGRPTAGVLPLAKELGLDKKGGCILSYNGSKIIDCRTGETLYQKQLDAQYVPELCAFAAAQNVTIITYNKEGVVTERPEDEWAAREGFTCHLPMIKVEDLANICHISETHFRRVFTSYMKMSPLEYINTVRVYTACELLETTDAPVADVAHKCGFTTNSTFNRNFKQLMGVTPLEWRKRPESYEQQLLRFDIHSEKGW